MPREVSKQQKSASKVLEKDSWPDLLPIFSSPVTSRIDTLFIDVKNDFEAVAAWLQEYQDSPQTLKSYRREAERLLLWLTNQDKPLCAMNRELLRQYEVFLENPQPAQQWVGPTKPRHHAQWRPFRGGLSPASRRQSLIILQGMYSWLIEAGWVSHNPFVLMRDKARRLNNQTQTIERYLERDLWAWCWEWMNASAKPISEREAYEQARRRFIFSFAYLLAPRISEMANAQMDDFQEREGRWWWVVVGKGSKLARVPVPDDMLECLIEWREALALKGLPSYQEPTPLIRALDKHRGITDNQLYRLIKGVFSDAADALEAQHGKPAYVSALRRATPHWLRHTAITHQAQSGVSLRYLAESARHSKLDTTSRYLHTEDHEWHREQQRHRLKTPPKTPSNPL
ncbi:site-specific integrase [Vreelandella andesensis]|uniref:Site-specific integrase n=1 Tax=Vreelandella andesensis TaxID=447567 RepID=A0A433KFB0_9GAMM|nr:site-specific integrase [Halomonas andesensis]RUR27235.1 site-specific integrase [Halomonas andesensis]